MFKKINLLIVAVALFVLQSPLFLIPVSAAVDICTWDGSTDANWSTATNWSCTIDGEAAPEDDDTLIFPVSASNKTNTNDMVGKDFEYISILGDDYIITGNDITISPASSSTVLQIAGSNNDFGLDTTLTKNDSLSLSSPGIDNEISGEIILNLTGGGDMNVGSSGSNTLTISGGISGNTDGFIISNGGVVEYSGISTFTSTQLQINGDSAAVCGADDCLGVAANNLSIYGAGALLLNTTSPLENDVTFQTGTDNPVILAVLNNAEVDGNITLNDNAFIAATTSTALLVNGSVSLGANTITYAGASGSQIVHNGSIDGTGDVVVDGTLLQMINPNTYTGETTITTDSTLVASAVDSLGTSAGATIVEDDATLQFNPFADQTSSENITVQGDGAPFRVGAIELFNANFDIDLDGTITLLDNTTFANRLAGTDVFIVSGVITGTGDLTFTGETDSGGFELAGSLANDYIGTTNVNSTDLNLSKNNNIVAIPSDVTVDGTSDDAALILNSDENIADDSTITLNNSTNSATFSIPASVTETVGTIVGDGILDLGLFTPILNVGADNENGVFTGEITSDEGEIEKVGTGTWNVQGINTPQSGGYTIYRVSNGKLLFNWADTSGQFSGITVSGGTLGGSEVIGATAATGGSIAPGNSPGCLNPDGTLSLNSSSTLAVEISGATVCTEYDKITATGAVTLGNATLSLSPSYTPAANTEFTIVEGSSVSGTFNGLADGATVTANGLEFRINYTANTVKLTFLRGVLSQTGSSTSTLNSKAGIALVVSVISILGIAVRQRKSFKFLLDK